LNNHIERRQSRFKNRPSLSKNNQILLIKQSEASN
jgi:hypothetical protein